MPGQSIRPSQFITTYGPGSILEGPDGPRIIMSLNRSGLFTSGRSVTEFDITYPRLSGTLLEGAGILRLPTNAEVGLPDSEAIYETRPFPAWSLCQEHGILYRAQPNSGSGCPRCPPDQPWAIWRRARREAIRFVRACPEGHLDDVDWPGVVDHRQRDCRPAYLEWSGRGGTLRNIELRCPGCQGLGNLGLAYARDWPCNGRLPESGDPAPGRCAGGARPAKIVQRGAANLRVPEILTAINIHPTDTPLHRVLGRPEVRSALLFQVVDNRESLLSMLRRLADNGMTPKSEPLIVEHYTDGEVEAALRDLRAPASPTTSEELREQEFRELQRAAAYGAPARTARTPDRPPVFEALQEDVRAWPGPAGTELRVTPISRLQVTMVQHGYRRLLLEDPFRCAEVGVEYTEGDRRWYPGVELFGEGVFVDLAPAAGGWQADHPELRGADAGNWQQAWANPEGYLRRGGEHRRLHPVFVWWHTFAHRLIAALAIDSGYSSASVRERVYVVAEAATGRASGGVLLYTAQPGGDGTLGGLISLVPAFDRVLERALRDLDACSNDPLCGEERYGPGRHNGAACYACLMVSETSCEFRNTSLDRNLLQHNLP